MSNNQNLISGIIDLMNQNNQTDATMSHQKQLKTMDALNNKTVIDANNQLKVALEEETTQRLKDAKEHELALTKLSQDFAVKQDSINKQWQLDFEKMKQEIKTDYDNQQLITQTLLPVQVQQQIAKTPDPEFSYDDLAVSISAGDKETRGAWGLNPLVDDDMTEYLKGAIQGLQPQMKELKKLGDGSVDKTSAIDRLLQLYNDANVDAYVNDDWVSGDEQEREMLKMLSNMLKQLGYDKSQIPKPVFDK